MKRIYFVVSLLAAMLTISCVDTDNDLERTDVIPSSTSANVINRTAEAEDGVRYSLKDLAINPDLTPLTNKDVALKSSKSDLEKGIYDLELLTHDAAAKILVGNTLYLRTEQGAHLRRIKDVQKLDENSYVLQTESAPITDLFESGTISFDIDINKVQKTRSLALAPSDTRFATDINLDIFNFVKEYKTDAFTFNPNSSLSTSLHFEITFAKLLTEFPVSFEVSYEIKPSINPYFNFLAVASKQYNVDLLDHLPEGIMEQLRKIEISIDIPAGTFGTFPAKVSIDQLHMPLSVFANLSKEVNLEYNLNGSVKIGYAYYSSLLNKKSGFIYQNTLTANHKVASEMAGEVISDLYFVIEPKIELADLSLFNVKGDLSVGVEAIAAGKVNPIDGKFAFASEGKAKALGLFDVYFMGRKVLTTEVLNKTFDLWTIGNLDKSIKLSNLKMTKPSIIPCRLNSFSYAMKLDYSYFVGNKKVAYPVILTYDVYDDKGRSLKNGEKLTLTQSDMANGTIDLDLCIPFRKDFLAITTGLLRPSSYIRNMTFTDSYGYKGGIPDFEVGSPYNNNFWK